MKMQVPTTFICFVLVSGFFLLLLFSVDRYILGLRVDHLIVFNFYRFSLISLSSVLFCNILCADDRGVKKARVISPILIVLLLPSWLLSFLSRTPSVANIELNPCSRLTRDLSDKDTFRQT